MAFNVSLGADDRSALGLSASTVIKATPGRVLNVNVTTAGVAGAMHDATTVGGVSAATLIAVVPATVGPLVLNWTCNAGIVYIVGAGQVVSVSYV